MNIQKIKTYIGFAKKSNSVVYGVDSIKEKKVNVVIYSNALAEASKQRCVSLRGQGVKVFEVTDEQMLEIIENVSVKAFGIKNKELAKAIINNF
ncbi:MAG: hypothetical protein IKC11_04035 [Clostridia bacterium]|nr:hypothetical protein [Clostridia bacterium]